MTVDAFERKILKEIREVYIVVNGRCESNVATVSGVIVNKPVFGHEIYGEGFYYFDVRVRRLSNSYDVIPITVSDRLADFDEYEIGRYIEVEGQFRSYNAMQPDGTTKLMLTVFARDIHFFNEGEEYETDVNNVVLDGFICKKPVYRKTPFNREITDFLLAVNRSYNKSDYIPCISWGRNARFCGKRSVGENVRVTGRMQSRKYEKKFEDGTVIEKVAYEVSVSQIEINRGEIPAQEEITEVADVSQVTEI